MAKISGTERRRHVGPARVFDGEEACIAAISARQITPGAVLVIRNEGPAGGPGMREMLSVTSASSAPDSASPSSWSPTAASPVSPAV